MIKRAVILAGGLGTRLKPFTDAIPKPLLPIGEKAVLEIQIERLVRFGFEEVYIATNYKSNYIENFLGDGQRYGVKIFFSKEETPLGTAGPLKLLEDKLDAPFLVLNGDILTLTDFGDMFDYAVKRDSVFIAGIKEIVMPYAFGNIFLDGERVVKIEEKPNIVTYALAGINLLKPEIFRWIPAGQYYGMDALLQALIRSGEPIIKYDIGEYWLDIGRMDDYEKAQADCERFDKE